MRASRVFQALAVIVAVGLLALPYIAPILQPFMDPVHGVLAAGRSASLPAGTLVLEGAPGEAIVVWDEAGIPHIYAETDEAGVYALGWVSASLRLFQMDLLRRVGTGTLSELVGEAGLDNDVFMRSLGVNHVVEAVWERIVEDPELQKLEDLLLAYTRGVNDYIEYAVENNLLPVEYRVLRVEPEPWKPTDTIAISRVIALGLAWNDEDLVLAKLVEKWGPEIVDVMGMATWEGTVEQADCALATTWGEASGASNAYDYARHVQPTGATSAATAPPSFDAIREWIQSVVEPLRGVVEAGSNNWVVAPAYTGSGKPLLANDPHLQLSAPPIWLAAEIITPSFKSIGVLFPGTPLIVIGRNPYVAWAFTNVMGDFTDYYYYVWDGDRYLYKGEWLEAEKRVEAIKVRDPFTGEVTWRNITVLETIHGPVLERDGERLAVSWTGLYPSVELQFFVELNNASSVREALAAQRWFHVPVQNFVVADAEGNIAYSPVGGYPVRVNTPVLVENPRYAPEPIVNKGMLPFNGSRGEGEWAGYIPKEELPVLYNPPVEFIATANSKPWKGGCGDFVGWHYGDKYRQERIVEYLSSVIREKGRVVIDDVVALQNDVVDLSIEDYLETAILPYAPEGDEWAQALRDWLDAQGAVMDPDSWQPTLAMAWVAAYHMLLWEHLYGSTDDISFLRFHYALSIVRAAASGDDYALQLIPGGSLEAAAAHARSVAEERLRAYYGTSDPETWKYGEIHYYNMEHAAFPALSYERLPAPGGPYSVNPARPADFDAEKGMPVTHGPSMRQIVCLAVKGYMLALPGGESGNPLSPHYQDHYLEYWYRGEYQLLQVDTPPEALPGPRLVIEPAGGGGP